MLVKQKKVDLSLYGYSILQIETKSVCNMNCLFCAYGSRKDKGRTLSREDVLGLIDSLDNSSGRLKYVCFSHFNEPLLDERIYDFIEYARKKGFPVLIITNGLLFKDKEIVSRLIDSGPEFIKLSLQVLNESLFKSSRGINGQFTEYKSNVVNFLKSSLDGSSQVTVDIACNFLSGFRNFKTKIFGLERGDPSVYPDTDSLKDDIKVFLNDLKKIDLRFSFDLNKIDNYLKSLNQNYALDQGFVLAGNIILKIKPFIYGMRLREFYPLKTGSKCPNEILGILAGGEVVPCCLAYGDMLTMGNIKNEALDDILEKNKVWIDNLHKGRNLPLTCRRCLGAPTKRGAIVKGLKARVK
ncbi:MAG: radical SAM protein [Candidatus Omnitrophica bacterium]|nr:radical SAM protein [Candidatus Omnitrophota bacterium]